MVIDETNRRVLWGKQIITNGGEYAERDYYCKRGGNWNIYR